MIDSDRVTSLTSQALDTKVAHCLEYSGLERSLVQALERLNSVQDSGSQITCFGSDTSFLCGGFGSVRGRGQDQNGCQVLPNPDSLESDIVTVPITDGWRRMLHIWNLSIQELQPRTTNQKINRRWLYFHILSHFKNMNEANYTPNKIVFAPHTRLCFYPSSGDRALWTLMRLDCDLFVMAEKWREAVSWQRIQADFKKQGLPIDLVHQGEGHLCFRSQGKTAWIFIEDNNVTLARLHSARLTIHHFVGICDGCREGGNHECVHERPFLSRVLPLADPGMAYTTDHSRPLERERPRYWGSDVSNHPRFTGMVEWRHFPEPPFYRQGLGPDLHEQVCSSTRFELQGVLVAPHHSSHDSFKASDLVVLPKGNFTTQLDSLIPFRILYGRGVLAEYRVFWEQDWNDGLGSVGHF